MGVGVAEDEVAEAHVFLHQVMQVDIHLRGVLVDEMEVFGLGPLPVLRLLAHQDQRHVLVGLTDLAQQLQARIGIALLDMGEPTGNGLQRETGVGDDAQCVVVVALIPLHGLLVVGGQHHLGASALALGGSVGVEGLGGEAFRLSQDIAVEVGQHGGVEADVVLNQQDHLHTGLVDVVLDVHLVLDELDDGEDQIGVAKPAEHVVEHRHVLVLYALRDAMGEGCQHHAGDGGVLGLHLAGHGEGIVVGVAGHTDHQVDVGSAQHLVGLGGG